MKLATQILLAFSIVLILSIIDTASNYLLSLKVKENTEFLYKSQDIIRNSGRLHKSMIEMQSSMRGFLLTEDTIFLDGYKDGLKNIPALYTEEHKLVENNQQQVLILDTIIHLHNEWVNYANSMILTRKDGSALASTQEAYNNLFVKKFKKGLGKNINDQIGEKILDFDRIEYKTRSIHSANLIASIQNTHAFSLTFFALTIIIGIATTAYILSLISKRINTMVQLAENISAGNFATMNDTRKDELTGLSISLNIMSEKLKKNITELEQRNTELDKFAYVVSHDLKAPIRGIHNVINWIGEDFGNAISEELRKYLNIISQRTRRMEDLINGLLDYAKIREKTTVELTDVNELVKEISEMVVPRNFKVEIQNLPVIITERLKLEQVFTNLISNAVKYTSHQNGEIIVSCGEFPHYYEFAVKDNGIGIEQEYHDKIFEMFQTLREKHEKESTGIGLAIIKKILEDQHCTIRVNSVLGKGSEFIFTWPRIQ